MSNGQRVLECLNDGYATVNMLSERVGIDETNVRRWLKKHELDGAVESFDKDRVVWWKRRQNVLSAADLVEDAIAEVEVNDRVALAQELVELERRRVEILEKLR